MPLDRVGKIERIPVRQVWRHEARDFTSWLEQNIELLSDLVAGGIDVESVRREVNAGDFSVDLVAQDNEGKTIVIENQLERSNHDHLGKLLTYRAMLDAEIVVWIVTEARPEHTRVLAWLNDHTDVAAYMIKLEAVRIGDSEPAPLLTTIVEPSELGPGTAIAESSEIERHQQRRQFWRAVIDASVQAGGPHSGLSPSQGPYLGTSAGIPGVQLNFAVREHSNRVIVWIDRGDGQVAFNDAVFQALLDQREEIEREFGEALTWEAKDANRSRKLVAADAPGGWRDAERYRTSASAAVERMKRLEATIRPRLRALAASGAFPEPQLQ